MLIFTHESGSSEHADHASAAVGSTDHGETRGVVIAESIEGDV